MADQDGQDPVTEDQQAVIDNLRNELQIANLMLADLSTQLAGERIKRSRAEAINQLSQPTA
ncbi:hypothetical protein QMQ05_05810 [Glutamicibacter ectropisis]|uniref:Uncharacterized protein n=1 Tax=Glutamicibacter ectropisis TaxID=3046593 RepID=A0AAU6WFV2_9MICC